MKKILIISLNVFILAFLVGCSEESSSGPETLTGQTAVSDALMKNVKPTPVPSLTQEMIDGLLYMREEEKVARDVYTVLGKKWNTKTFANIASSEQQHMNSIAQLITLYGLVDPVQNNPVGVFTNAELQDIYTTLVAQGSLSLKDGYTVGTLIEQQDINDLVVQLGIVPAGSNLAKLYTNLKLGSQNHLTAFTLALQRIP